MEAQQKTPQEILEPRQARLKIPQGSPGSSQQNSSSPFLMADNIEFLNFFHNRSKASPPHF